MRTTRKLKTRIEENVPSNLFNRLLEEGYTEMMQAAEMLALHTVKFEKDLISRVERQELDIKELKKELNGLKTKLK